MAIEIMVSWKLHGGEKPRSAGSGDLDAVFSNQRPDLGFSTDPHNQIW